MTLFYKQCLKVRGLSRSDFTTVNVTGIRSSCSLTSVPSSNFILIPRFLLLQDVIINDEDVTVSQFTTSRLVYELTRECLLIEDLKCRHMTSQIRNITYPHMFRLLSLLLSSML
jgi:hypothetical protein